MTVFPDRRGQHGGKGEAFAAAMKRPRPTTQEEDDDSQEDEDGEEKSDSSSSEDEDDDQAHLYLDREDRKRLKAMTELEREMILAQRNDEFTLRQQQEKVSERKGTGVREEGREQKKGGAEERGVSELLRQCAF